MGKCQRSEAQETPAEPVPTLSAVPMDVSTSPVSTPPSTPPPSTSAPTNPPSTPPPTNPPSNPAPTNPSTAPSTPSGNSPQIFPAGGTCDSSSSTPNQVKIPRGSLPRWNHFVWHSSAFIATGTQANGRFQASDHPKSVCREYFVLSILLNRCIVLARHDVCAGVWSVASRGQLVEGLTISYDFCRRKHKFRLVVPSSFLPNSASVLHGKETQVSCVRQSLIIRVLVSMDSSSTSKRRLETQPNSSKTRPQS